MASAPYLDDVKNSLNKLPEELHRNFSLMQELDSRSQKLMNNIDKMADNYMSNVKEYSSVKKKETMASIQRQFDTAKAYSDDKVQLSVQTYELVDKHIRKLDAELLRFKEKIQLRTDMYAAAIKGGLKMTSAPPSTSAVTDPSNLTNSKDNVAVETSSLSGVLVGTGIAHSAYVDMPIDPNEPTFCLCNQVSFGEMIGCDNPNCDIEWFHFACVSLINKPKGKWICPKCITDKKKK